MIKKFNIKNIKNKKAIVFLLLILVVGIVGGTFALFKLSHGAENKFTISSPDVVLEETEDVLIFSNDNKTLERNVFVRNYGTADMLVRVSYNEMFYNPEYSTRSYTDAYSSVVSYNSLGEVVQKNWTQDFKDNWELHNGWYYYKKVFEGNEENVVRGNAPSINPDEENVSGVVFATTGREWILNPQTGAYYDATKSVNSLHVLESVTIKGDYNPHPYMGLDYRLDFHMESIQATEAAVQESWGVNVEISESGDVSWQF